jgi:hypothetical protein
VGLAFDGRRTLAAWADFGLLQLERFDAEMRPVGKPVVLDQDAGEENTLWLQTEVAFGAGMTLVVAKSNDYYSNTPAIRGFLVSADDAVRRVPVMQVCPVPEATTADEVDVVWTGTRFVVAANCEAGGLRLLSVSAGGAVRPIAVVPGGGGAFGSNEVSLASTGGGFVVVYERTTNADRDIGDVLVRRYDAAGAPTGGIDQLATAVSLYALDITVSASWGRYLAAWSQPATARRALRYRVIGPSGLGEVRRVGGLYLPDTPLLTPARDGSWWLLYLEHPGIMAVTIGAGLAHGPPRRLLASTRSDGPSRPAITPTVGGAAVLAAIPIHPTQQSIAPDGRPFGRPERFGRVPAGQVCQSVSAGSHQFLVAWQERRIVGGTNVYAQRFSSSGERVGGRIALSAASGNQFCPRAAWDGSQWLVAWTDERNGDKDVFATTVSGAGSVDPASGFPISASAGSQQSPALTFNGRDFVVAWNDLRNGNQDIYAARVTPERVVREPTGLAVTTSPRPGNQPTVASLAGRTLVAWSAGHEGYLGVRVLRSDGTFASDPTRASSTPAGAPSAIAASAKFVVSYVYFGDAYTFAVDPASGVPGVVREIETAMTLNKPELVYDRGTIGFAAQGTVRQTDGELLSQSVVGVLSLDRTAIADLTPLPMDPGVADVAVLPGGTGLVVGHDRRRLVASTVR